MRKVLCGLFALLCVSCTRSVFKEKWTREQSPSTFVARFETSKGNFDVAVNREWSPLAADRFYQLVKHHYYDSGIFYRVVPNFVAQFGNSDSVRANQWRRCKLADEQVLHSNKKGAISFARGGKETRSTELYINLVDNLRLDTIAPADVKGYPSFGDVIHGMDVVSSLYSGYSEKTRGSLNMMYANRKEFLKTFPQLDIIRRAYLLK